MLLTREIVIAAPPAVVFSTVTDIPRWADNISAITRIDMLSEGPVGVGTRFRETRRMFGREAREEMEVQMFAPPRRFVLTAESAGTRYLAEHLFEPVPGGTRLTLVFSGEPRTFTARLFAPIGRLMIKSLCTALDADLADLKAAIEAAHTSGA